MSWDSFDLLGDDPQDEMFGSELYGNPTGSTEDVSEQEDIDFDEPNQNYYEDYDEDYEDYDTEGDDLSYFDISDIDFSSLDSKNFKSNLKTVRRAVKNKPVVSRTKSNQLKPSRGVQKPIAQRPRPVSSRPVGKTPSAAKPVLRPATAKPMLKPTMAQKPLLKKPMAKPTQKSDGMPKMPRMAEQAKREQAQKRLIQSPSKPTAKSVDIEVKKRATIKGKKDQKTIGKVIVPEDRTVVIEGVDRFMLSNSKNAEAIRQIGYYKGEKLKELVLIINNTTPNDIDLELFNPSQPLDYLYSTSQNLNNIVSVAGDNKVAYTDVLFNLLANPALLPNAKFTVTGGNIQNQFNQPLIFKNKNVAGFEKIHPIQNNLNIDIDQNQNRIVYWNILETLGRAYIPDGMDVIQYKVLAGNSVVFGFYYKQVSLKRFFWKEARDKRIL